MERESELLASDLPAIEEISLGQAVAWLCGYPINHLDNIANSTPDARCLAATGRRYKSAGFWSVVAEWIRARQDDPEVRLDWSMLNFVSDCIVPKTKMRKERAERTLAAALFRHCSYNNFSIEDYAVKLNSVRSVETERIWLIRDVLLQLLVNLERILPPSSLSKFAGQAVNGRPDFRNRIHLSLGSSRIYRRNDKDASSSGSVELWKPRVVEVSPELLIDGVNFNRAALISAFVTLPDKARDEWIDLRIKRPFWDPSFTLLYLRFAGHMESIFRQTSGIVSEYDLAAYGEESADRDDWFDTAVPRDFNRLEELLRYDIVKAFGVREGSNQSEPIPLHELDYLEFRSSIDMRQFYLVDATKATALRWNAVRLRAEDVMMHLPPDLTRTGDLIGQWSENSQKRTARYESRAIVKAKEYLRNHERPWSISYQDVLDYLKIEELNPGTKAWVRIKKALRTEFPAISRKGVRPTSRPENWTW
tara:strand:+ start:1196 stop:2629 length:1434 start_codon:yes stop_codon:yes gene_type:complete